MKGRLILVNQIKNPKISVIIPTLNEEKYIEKTLLALRAQTIKLPYEIIVSDGRSKDRTFEIAKKYANKIVTCNKKGISVGRNLGAKYADGEILVFIDADTIALPNTLEEVYKEVKKRNVALVSCPVAPSSYSPSFYFIYWFYNQFSKNSIKIGKPQIAGMFMATKRNIFNMVGGFDERLKISEDYDFSEKVSKLGEVKIVDSTFVLTSPRRIEKWGRAKGAVRYLGLYFAYLLTGKDIGWKIYKSIR
jgi:glycosyltransferase involved in cell wall biosynthesis